MNTGTNAQVRGHPPFFIVTHWAGHGRVRPVCGAKGMEITFAPYRSYFIARFTGGEGRDLIIPLRLGWWCVRVFPILGI